MEISVDRVAGFADVQLSGQTAPRAVLLSLAAISEGQDILQFVVSRERDAGTTHWNVVALLSDDTLVVVDALGQTSDWDFDEEQLSRPNYSVRSSIRPLRGLASIELSDVAMEDFAPNRQGWLVWGQWTLNWQDGSAAVVLPRPATNDLARRHTIEAIVARARHVLNG